MKPVFNRLRLAAAGILVMALCGGCASDDGGSVSGSAYYGVGIYDPWFYGDYYYDDPDIIVTPPGDRPDPPPRPSHPIARPPAAAPRPMPMPSIPMAPRPALRR